MSESSRPRGILARLRPLPGQEDALLAHEASWHRTAGRILPGTRLHLLFERPDAPEELFALHLFENEAVLRRAVGSETHREWQARRDDLLAAPSESTEVTLSWSAATDARPSVSVSIDRDVHALVQDLITRLLARHPRTPAEDLYLTMLQSIADDYEREYPGTSPEEGDLR